MLTSLWAAGCGGTTTCDEAGDTAAACGATKEAEGWRNVADCSGQTACIAACTAEASCDLLNGSGDLWRAEIRESTQETVRCLHECFGTTPPPPIDHTPPTVDPPDDFIDSESANAPNVTVPQIDLVGVGGQVVRAISSDANDELFNNSIYECGSDRESRLVVCADNVLPMPGGDMAVMGHMLAATVPRADTSMSYIHAAVFDSDGDPANDWVFQQPFDFDLFQGTDRWYQLVWDHQSGAWSLTATQVASDMTTTTVPTTARALIGDTEITWYISTSEFTAAAPGYRLTSFGHDGNFSRDARGADVNGADPTGPLLPLN